MQALQSNAVNGDPRVSAMARALVAISSVVLGAIVDEMVRQRVAGVGAHPQQVDRVTRAMVTTPPWDHQLGTMGVLDPVVTQQLFAGLETPPWAAATQQ